MPAAQIHKQFMAGALYAIVEEGMLLLQVSDDFDVFKKQVDELIGCKSHSCGESPFRPTNPVLGAHARIWTVSSSKVYDKIVSTYFQQYKKPEQIRNKLTINSLALMPIALNHPILPNDLGDVMRGTNNGGL